MRGQSVELVPFIDDEDFALRARWNASPTSVYGSGSVRFLTADEFKELARGSDASSGSLLVRTRGDGRPVGAVEWRQLAYPGNFAMGNVVGDAELWGRGYGFESILLLLELLFHSYNAHRVEVTVGVYNKRMLEVLTQGHIRVEGVLRDYFFIDGEYHDAVVAAILRNEYYQMSGGGTVARDAIPAAEKQQARQLLRKYLADHPIGG